VIAGPVTWSARIIEAHPGPVNAAFATIQLLLGLGIIAVVFALFMAGYVAWLGDRLSAVGAAVITTGEAGTAVRSTTGTARPARMGTTAQAGGCWPALAPRGACCYKIAMAIVMGYMLIIML
jgi:hypothetical protein